MSQEVETAVMKVMGVDMANKNDVCIEYYAKLVNDSMLIAFPPKEPPKRGLRASLSPIDDACDDDELIRGRRLTNAESNILHGWQDLNMPSEEDIEAAIAPYLKKTEELEQDV
jgi:hypothetical protein